MGYWVSGRGTINWEIEDEDNILKALNDLNHQHDLKRGRRSPASGDPYEDYWFAWVDARYHEKGMTIEQILEMVGFELYELTTVDGWRRYRIEYSSKAGQEDLFLLTMVEEGADLDTEWEGEDGDGWKFVSEDNKLLAQDRVWDYEAPYEAGPTIRESAKKWNEGLSLIANPPADA
jgi:hypothetical protein